VNDRVALDFIGSCGADCPLSAEVVSRAAESTPVRRLDFFERVMVVIGHMQTEADPSNAPYLESVRR